MLTAVTVQVILTVMTSSSQKTVGSPGNHIFNLKVYSPTCAGSWVLIANVYSVGAERLGFAPLVMKAGSMKAGSRSNLCKLSGS